MQHNKYVEHQDVKIYCSTNQFTGLNFLGPHNKPYGVCGLDKHYYIRFDIKLGHGTCAINCMPCACTLCNYILDQQCITGLKAQQKPCYQTVKDITYRPVLGSFNN